MTAFAVKRTILVEVDYRYEASSPPTGPSVGTLRLATKEYFDDAESVVYAEAINSIPQYSRGLQGERLGDYRSTIGTLEINNADGEYDYLLGLALDGSEVRVFIGDINWLRVDFRHAFTAIATKAVAPSQDRISIQLKDTTAFLNKAIVGSSVGGTGSNADRPRPVNFGYVHQIEALVYDEFTLQYVHSDTDTVSAAIAVRDNGLDSNFIDNGDGTFTLDQSPVNTNGGITADVLAVATGSPADTDERRISHAFRYFIGDRAGLAAEGLYLGPGPTFTPYDQDDYYVGISVAESKNVIDLLGELADSGNCFWAITREGNFTFGRLNPNDLIDGSPTNATDIEFDDIDVGTIRVDHTSPKYYKLQAYMSRNWTQTNVLATGIDADERALRTRKGLYVIQADSTTNDYASSPQLYSISLTESPPLETLLSGNDDETDRDALAQWMERRRTMFLPWIETFSFTVHQEFFELEIGDVVRLTMPRYGLDSGALFQVVGIDLRLTEQKIGLQIMRRRASEFVPVGFERDTFDDTRLVTGIKIPQPPPTPPPGPPEPPITIIPTPPIGFPIRPPSINPIHPGLAPCRQELDIFDYLVEFSGGHMAMNSTGTYCAVASDSSLGRYIYVYRRNAQSYWRNVAILTSAVNVQLGWFISIADDLTIVTGGGDFNKFSVFTYNGVVIGGSPSTEAWIEHIVSQTTEDSRSFGGDLVINRQGTVIAGTGYPGGEAISFYRPSLGSWALTETWISPEPGYPSDYASFLGLAFTPNGQTLIAGNQRSNSSTNRYEARVEVLYSASLTGYVHVQTCFGPTDSEFFSIYGAVDISDDGTVIAAGFTAYNSGTSFPTVTEFQNIRYGRVYIFAGNTISGYTQQCELQTGGKNDAFNGIGGDLCLSGDGDTLITGGPEGGLHGWTGLIYYITNLSTKTGTIDISNDPDAFEVINPYIGAAFSPYWGDSVAMDKAGRYFALGSEWPTHKVEFRRFSCLRLCVSEGTLYDLDEFTDSDGTQLESHLANKGRPWVSCDIPGFAASTDVDDFVIENNKIGVDVPTLGADARAINLSVAPPANQAIRLDCVFQDYGGNNTNTTEVILIARYQNNGNFFLCRVTFNDGFYDTDGNALASVTLDGAGNGGTYSGDYFNQFAFIGPGPKHVIVWELFGHNHTVTIDGNIAIEYTDSNSIVSGFPGFGYSPPISSPTINVPDRDFEVDRFKVNASLCPNFDDPYVMVASDLLADADNSQLVDRVGLVGAEWARLAAWSNNPDLDSVIDDGALIMSAFYGGLTRPTGTGTPSSGTALAYPSGKLVSGTKKFYIQFTAQFRTVHAARVGIYENVNGIHFGGSGPDANDLLFYLSSNGNSHTTGSVGDIGDFTFTPVHNRNPPYLIRLEVDNYSLQLYVDGAPIRTWERASIPIGDFGLFLRDTDGVAAINVNNFKIVEGL